MSLVEKADKVLDEIRPHLAADGGNVEVVEVTQDNILIIKWLGNCTPVVTVVDIIVNSDDHNTLEAAVAPNPTSDRLNLRVNGLAIGHFYLYDAAGTLLLDKKASGGSTSIDLSSLRAGLYLLKYTDRNGIDIFERIIKQ